MTFDVLVLGRETAQSSRIMRIGLVFSNQEAFPLRVLFHWCPPGYLGFPVGAVMYVSLIGKAELSMCFQQGASLLPIMAISQQNDDRVRPSKI